MIVSWTTMDGRAPIHACHRLCAADGVAPAAEAGHSVVRSHHQSV